MTIIRSSEWTGRLSTSPLIFVIGSAKEMMLAGLSKGFNTVVRDAIRVALTDVSDDCIVHRIEMRRNDSMLLVRYYSQTVNVYRVEDKTIYPQTSPVWKPKETWSWSGRMYMKNCVLAVEMEK